MRKSIIKSIRSQHVCNILNLIKTIEIDKSAPKEWKDYLSGKTRTRPKPREVLIYCTKGDKNHCLEYADNPNPNGNGGWFITSGYPYGNGKVLGKFTLIAVDKIFYRYWRNIPGGCYETNCFGEDILLKYSCLSWSELNSYLKEKTGYAWYIDNLVIFDKPKELSEFRHPHCDNLKNINVVHNLIYDDYVFQYYDNERCKNCKSYNSDANDCLKDYKPLTKAPQSWCYCLYIENKEED